MIDLTGKNAEENVREKSQCRVAVIGYGHLGRWHAEKADQLANLHAIVERHPVQAEKARVRFPGVQVVADLKEVLNHIDAGIIVTPTSTHFSFLKQLLESQKHIFCEKPLCSNSQEAKEIRSLFQDHDHDQDQDHASVLQVGHSERFHESWEIIEKYRKYLAGPCVIRMNRFAPFKGRATDVDVVQDLMIHDLDLLVYLLGEMPVSVSSTGYRIRTETWDYVCSEFIFDSGKRAYVVASRNHVKEVRDMEVFSDEGCLYVDLFRNEIHLAPQDRTSTGEFVESLEYGRRDHLLLEQQHFFSAIEKRAPPVVGLEDGLTAVHLISKVLESLEGQGRVAI